MIRDYAITIETWPGGGSVQLVSANTGEIRERTWRKPGYFANPKGTHKSAEAALRAIGRAIDNDRV